MPSSQFTRNIHLLYVPTLACNLACKYCYLGDQTDKAALKTDTARAASTLNYGIRAFLDAGVLPFNVSLHGGEPTILPPAVLDELFTIIHQHYMRFYDELTARGYKKSVPHIKTNLFNFNKLYDLFDRHRVSISASIDLPLKMHESLRKTRQGRSWLQKTINNLGLLASYPHSKKISSTLYMEHLQDIGAIVKDIWMIHQNLAFDMNNFNIMFGFESSFNRDRFGHVVHAAPEELQVRLYEQMKQEFAGTALEEGLRRNWFDEFKPTYCTNAFNCGERFFLLKSDGSVWSCVRGQGLEQCFYGNIFQDSIEQILDAGQRAISILHQQSGFSQQCRQCSHLHICHTGCPVVKMQKKKPYSYTCNLQKAIYRDNPVTYPPAGSPEQQQKHANEYIAGMHPAILFSDENKFKPPKPSGILMPRDLKEARNGLSEIIERDEILQTLYSDDSVLIEINGEKAFLASQILKTERIFYFLGNDDTVTLHLKRSLFTFNCDEPVRNTLYLQMLRDTPIIYGDEQRTKQEHLFTYQIFYSALECSNLADDDYVMTDISPLLRMNRALFLNGVLNNLFVTTSHLREYHYQKQKNNGFYHIQAINLPFQNMEFYWT